MAIENATLEEFGVHEKCVPAVNKAMKPETSMKKEKVPDFWYTFCVSQDCAHYLPSRHRWCVMNHAPTPTHSNAICLLVQEFAQESLGSYKQDALGADDLCG